MIEHKKMNLEKQLKLMYDFTMDFCCQQKSREIFTMIYDSVQSQSGMKPEEFRKHWLQYKDIRSEQMDVYGDIPELSQFEIKRQAD